PVVYRLHVLPRATRPPICTLFPYTTLCRSQAFACVIFRRKSPGGSQANASMTTSRGWHGGGTSVQCTSSTWRTVWYGSEASVSGDRKSTRLNSSHVKISYAAFCLKKKNPRE